MERLYGYAILCDHKGKPKIRGTTRGPGSEIEYTTLLTKEGDRIKRIIKLDERLPKRQILARWRAGEFDGPEEPPTTPEPIDPVAALTAEECLALTLQKLAARGERRIRIEIVITPDA